MAIPLPRLVSEEDGAAEAPQAARHRPQPPGHRAAAAAGGGGESAPRGAGGRCNGGKDWGLRGMGLGLFMAIQWGIYLG